MAMRMLPTLLPPLLLVLAGCGSRAGSQSFCGVAADLDAGKHVRLERIDLYLMGGYQHGSAVFDDACPSIRPNVDQYYVPASTSQKDRVDLATFWSTFLTKPRRAGGIFLVSVDATLAADIEGPVVRIEKMHRFNEVSEAEGARLYKVLAEHQ